LNKVLIRYPVFIQQMPVNSFHKFENRMDEHRLGGFAGF